MNRNSLYVLVGVLIIAVVGFGFYTYQQQNKPGVELKVNEDGVSLKKN